MFSHPEGSHGCCPVHNVGGYYYTHVNYLSTKLGLQKGAHNFPLVDSRTLHSASPWCPEGGKPLLLLLLLFRHSAKSFNVQEDFDLIHSWELSMSSSHSHSYDEWIRCHRFSPFKTHHWSWSNAHLESDVLTYIYIYIFTRVAYIILHGLWLPISLDSCLYCEDVIKSKLIYSVLMRPEIRPKHVSTPN